MKSLDLPYIPIAEARGFTATSNQSNTKFKVMKLIWTNPPLLL